MLVANNQTYLKIVHIKGKEKNNMNKLFTKIAGSIIGMAMAIGVGVAVGRGEVRQARADNKVTTYSGIVSGSDYYIGATTSGTDYYLSVDGSSTSDSIAGTAVDSTNSATVFTISGSGTSWSIKFKNYDHYLGLNSSKDNGKVQVKSSAVTFTASNQSGKIRLTIGSYSLQKNNSGTQFGSYGNTQTDLFLLPLNSQSSRDITFTPGTDTGTNSVTKNGVTASMSTMSNASYYQIYKNSTGTFSSTSGNILKIEFTCTASGTNQYGPGCIATLTGYSYSGNKGTWTGDAASVSMTASSNQVRISSLVITIASSGSVSPTSISCNAQTINVCGSVNIGNLVTFTPADTTETGLTFALKSGSQYVDFNSSTGVVTGKTHGSAVVTVTPTDTTGGATAIDVSVTVNAISAPGITVGNQYVLYSIDNDDSFNGEFSGISSNYGTAAQFTGTIPPCNYILETEAGYYENTVAFSHGNQYITCASDGKFSFENSITQASSWIVTWNSETYAATIQNTMYQTRSIMMNYNGGNPRFGGYVSGQKAVLLYPYVVKNLEDFTIESEINVYKSGTVTISVTYDPADASDKNLSWSSADETIATVDDGVVTGVAVGTTTVTASQTIGGNLVERTCTVHVLNNQAAHKGDSTDPFDVNDAVNVAKEVFTKNSAGTTINLENEYYVTGLITANSTRTTTNLSFWIGDNASETNASNGGFEVYKVAKIYGTNFDEYYSANNEITRDFNVGDYVTVKSTFTFYNNTTPETNQNVADVVWNNYIEARIYATETFLETLSTGTGAACKYDATTGAVTTDIGDLQVGWAICADGYSGLSAQAKHIFETENGSSAENAADVKKAIFLYTYIATKYNTQLESADCLSYNFMNRTITPQSNAMSSIAPIEGSNVSIIITVISVLSLTALGGFFFIKKRKEQ